MTLRSARSRQATIRRLRQGHQTRRGSALLVVMVLLAMLASLGVIFYLFAAQERQSSVYYSDAAKVRQYDLSVDTLMDYALEQLIVGPQANNKNSALYGRRHTLMGNMLGVDSSGIGFDFAPFNGTVLDPANPASLAPYDVWAVNDSPAANNGQDPSPQTLANLDADYTYPDLNSVFMSYDAYDPARGIRVIIPSFHRPQYLRNYFDSGSAPPPMGSPRWYDDTTTMPTRSQSVSGATLTNGSGQFTLRPHPSHVYVPPPGQQLTTTVMRYLTDAEAQTAFGSQTIGFPMVPPRDPALGNYGMRTTSGPALGQLGIWSYTSGPPMAGDQVVYEGDVDNDGDGVWEGVWLDLGFPPLEDASGQMFVPMFSFTIKDADALLNLNVHGNMAAVWAGDQALQAPFWTGNTSDSRYNPHISRSNLGLTPGEVNVAWGLTRRPETTALMMSGSTGHDGAYPADSFFSGTPVNWHETANRELQFLLQGRYTPSPSDLQPGRWGEDNLLYQAISNSSPRLSLYHAFTSSGSGQLADPWPGPGQTLIDDNGDEQQVNGGWYGGTYAPFGHPLDYTGLGSYYITDPTQTGVGTTMNDAGTGRLHWPRYNRYGNTTTAPVAWTALTNSLSRALYNDSAETVVDGDDARPEDNIFGSDEMRALHMSSTDFATATGGESRLTKLAPFNFDTTNSNFPSSAGSQRNTQEFRSKFTTRSWDRKQFSLAYSTTRNWEFNADADRDGKFEFPPIYGTSITPYSTTDGFRPVLRKLLETERENSDQPRLTLKLSLNQLLVGPNGNPFPTFSSTGQLPPNIEVNYRPLTPHPDPTTLTATVITDFGQNSYPATGQFSSAAQQEYWARIDRQLMARDIFMLLYTLGWPDGVNPVTPASGTPALDTTAGPGATALRQMAQFAVNVVDSLDRDNIVTRFEYDNNPSDGWDVNDNPYVGTSDSDRSEVWGVERLDLTLSEALIVHARQDTSNLSFTQWDDTQEQYFTYVELRNPGPTAVSLSQGAWQIEVGPDYLNTTNADLTKFRRLQLIGGSVPAGQLYTIGSANQTAGGSYPSIMKVAPTGTAPSDWDTDMTTWIAPNQQELDLDLKDSAQSANFSLTDAAGAMVTSGALFDTDTLTEAYVRLYRRANPMRPAPSTAAEEADNPYVMVDEIYVDNLTGTASSSARGGVLDLNSSDDGTMIPLKLEGLQSRERGEPFSGDTPRDPLATTPRRDYAFHDFATYANSLGNTNSNSPTEDANGNGTLDTGEDLNGNGTIDAVDFLNWQRVFDRDFASAGELLNVSLGGFSESETLRAGGGSRGPLPGIITGIDTSTSFWRAVTAANSTGDTVNGTAELFFLPFTARQGAANVPNWHRLLGLVDVPTREHAGIAGFTDPSDYPRVPGKLNVNMVRHPEVLAALIDDPTIMRLFVDEDANFNGMIDGMEDVITTNGPNQIDVFHPPLLTRLDDTGSLSWWQGFLASRDGYRNPTAPTNSFDPMTQMYLPGWAVVGQAASPFRSFTDVTGNHATETTLLRSWPQDSIPAAGSTTSGANENPRQLFEIGTEQQHQAKVTTQLDPYVRRRIMNKILNNTTTRSNVFVVFTSIKYFRAMETNGGIRIGGPLKSFTNTSTLPGSPPDRTDAGWQPEHRAFFVIDRSQLEKAYDRATGKIDFRPLVEFRQVLQ